MKKAPAVGDRPKCRYCHKELRPVYGCDVHIPIGLPSEEWRKQRAEHRIFTGKYGRYSDDKFCGLNCAYRFAVLAADKLQLVPKKTRTA